MPRLLLVDDNPSIHRIAESLLTGTAVELVCVESGEEALRRVNGGEAFDVALLDTVLGPGGMDGWALLDRLRQTPATMNLPIALMAGVLDAVDPLRLEKAPIQGFLRKPIELRDLEERLHTYMAAPMEGAGRGTVPGAKLQDWMSEMPAAPAPARGHGPEGDLLVLTAEDLLDAELPIEDLRTDMEHPAEPELHLEELDLATLHGVAIASVASASSAGVEPELPAIPSINLDEPLSHEMLAGLAPTAQAEGHAAVLELEPVMELETLHGLEEQPAAWSTAPTAPVPAVVPAAAVPAAAISGDAQAMVQAILADPNARQVLLKALLSQGGEQVLREVAWEVMPDLASKFQK